ncbi:MAG: hypothetical protein KatS3mg104_1743 [Phycisphaerae bacterium]|nr:MAG: hypothetical protein KatS3mg104_1743 [Phycisphaerae bacterium]
MPREASEVGLDLIQAIHPGAVVSRSARLGRNVVVAASAVVCTDAFIGDSCIIIPLRWSIMKPLWVKPFTSALAQFWLVVFGSKS